jgi:hypothetical protein
MCGLKVTVLLRQPTADTEFAWQQPAAGIKT